MDWQECLKNKLVKKISVDISLINSLKETSKNKRVSASYLEINEITSTSIITLYYDALREILEALAIKHGYKIYNHECYACFLKDILKNKEISERFNGIRKIRNSINYYGKRLSLEETKIVITDIKKLIEESKGML